MQRCEELSAVPQGIICMAAHNALYPHGSAHRSPCRNRQMGDGRRPEDPSGAGLEYMLRSGLGKARGKRSGADICGLRNRGGAAGSRGCGGGR